MLRCHVPPPGSPVPGAGAVPAQVVKEALGTSPDGIMPVGAHRLAGEPAALVLGQRLFTFPGGTEPGPG